MDESSRTLGWSDITQLAIAAVVLAVITLTTHTILVVVELPTLPLADADYPLSGWLWFLPPAVAIVILYPVFIAKSQFRRPTSRGVVIDQALFGFFLLPTMTVFAQLGIAVLAQFLSPAIGIPVVGSVLKFWAALFPPNLYLVILWPMTFLSIILGVFSALPLYYLIEKIYSRNSSQLENHTMR